MHTFFRWEFYNCLSAYPGVVGEALNADIELLASPGLGLVEKKTESNTPMDLPYYYNRTLMSDEELIWNLDDFVPDLVIISLGGNDYNH